ncbi:STAS domain-containing protein [Modestobacter versicolor]|uniref:STAS domain-containing protein n=1 Tax=Modestobacter versicolor TaxID=429133 RepID=UPI0034DE0EF6
MVVLGEVDSSNQVELGRLIAAAEAGRPDRLVLDLRRAPFLSFSALHLLAGARNRARAGGTSFEVLSDTRAVARSLRHLDLFP